MSVIRWFIGLPIAALITAGLFVMMSALINMDKGPLPEARDSLDIQILAQREMTQPPPTVKPPDPLPETPEIEFDHSDRNVKPQPVITLPEAGPINAEPGGGAGFPAPVIRYAPPYPENCRSRGLEGRVVAQFDVTREGTVTNIQIIESPNRCFDRAVIRTVSRWKYPPATANGRPTMRYGVVEVFAFQLDE